MTDDTQRVLIALMAARQNNCGVIVDDNGNGLNGVHYIPPDDIHLIEQSVTQYGAVIEPMDWDRYTQAVRAVNAIASADDIQARIYTNAADPSGYELVIWVYERTRPIITGV
jgi:hypothetical protein